MTQIELEQLIQNTESDRLEKTVSLTNTDKYSEAICAIANEQEERILAEKRAAPALTFDAQPCQEAMLTDLALGLFEAYRAQAVDEETIAANHRNVEDQLASLRFYSLRFGCPTYSGTLLFGRKPRYFLPGHYVQYLLFAGTDMADVPIDQAEIEGDLSSMIREIELRIRTIITNSLRQAEGWREKVQPDYPEWAVRELLLNALVHRDYASSSPVRFYVFADRIEITNPGGLYGNSCPENFPHVNAYRNPIVAEAVKTLGFINRFGYGVHRAKTLLASNGNPEPSFEFSSVWVKATVWKRRE